MNSLDIKWIELLPKAELHVHIEGTLTPELIFKLADKNGISLKYPSVEALHKAYNFNNLQEFLDIYYQGASVLLEEIDFYDLTYSYLSLLNKQNVLHCELFFDPQTHTERGVAFDKVIQGISSALKDAERNFGMTGSLIMCFLRHLSEREAFETLQLASAYKELIVGVGLDSSELGHPPSKFERVFEQARKEGYLTVAHAGEEGPSAYIWEAIQLLKISRIDHGNHCVDDEKLLRYIAEHKIPLTMCPVSNIELCVLDNLQQYPLRKLLKNGVVVTINSDDPAYFKGSLNENYIRLAQALDLNKEELLQLAINSFDASFIDESLKLKYKQMTNDYYNE